ncbi:HNH endonuclease [Massilia sp. KIM]|uniref:HNH endonuclease n=1 Tax=Massilia sp. KIM TaxID=1955422 RepID=UPI00098FDC13|nr:HNH endonuclease [Massilia sp. KIM]
MIGFRPVTQGEHLYVRVVDIFVNYDHALTKSIENFRNGSFVGNRSEEFADYFVGLYYFNLTARLVKTAKSILCDPNGNEFTYRSSFLTFLANQCSISEGQFGRANVNLLVNLSFEAALASGQSISNSTKNIVRASVPMLECYICGKSLFVNPVDARDAIEYEHVWPSSYGGDSIAANLLPACSCCNREKGAMMLWQDTWKHSLILPPYPSANDLTEINRPLKIALHRRRIFEYAVQHSLTLKDSALEIGPADFSAFAPMDLTDAADFFTIQF